MEEESTSVRFSLGRQSSGARQDNLAVEGESEVVRIIDGSDSSSEKTSSALEDNVPAGVRLMYAANEGDLDGIKELLESGVQVNFRDIDDRTPLHVAACQGYADAVLILLQNGADVESKDRWGSTPLADAIYYKNHEVIKVLEKNGAKPPMGPMYVKNLHHVPEYEIDPNEIDFTNSITITKGTFRKASWRGIEVAVKKFGDDIFMDEDKVKAFRDELALLQRIRHPNVVQFLGAVTQKSPMMIVTEYLPKGDFCQYLRIKGALKPRTAVRCALHIARGMNYLHEIKPEPIIHRDLEPANILRDDSGNLKVADFGVSKLLKAANAEGAEKDKPLIGGDTSYRYMAPELYRNEEYDTKVDVFSFALILQEMIEGCPPFPLKDERKVPGAYAENQRPPFRASSKHYTHGLKELIQDCWNQDPRMRPSFRHIIIKLDQIYNCIGRKRRWKVKPLQCFQMQRSHSNASEGGSTYARTP